MNNKKKTNTLTVICIILGAVILLLGAVIGGFLLMGRGESKLASSPAPSASVTYTAINDTALYSSPDPNSQPFATIPKGSALTFISNADNGFAAVVYNGLAGFVKSSDIASGDISAAQAAADASKTMYIINANPSAKLYLAPSTTSGTLAELPMGTPVKAYPGSVEYGLMKVEYNGSTGYVDSFALTEDYNVVTAQIAQKNQLAAAATPAPAPKNLPAGSNAAAVQYSMYVFNVENAIYLRTAPADEADIIMTIPLGAQVGYIDTVGSWHKISYNGKMGYSKAKYLTTSAPKPRASSSATRTIGGVEHSVYLRKNPTDDTSSANVLIEIPKGATVEYLGSSGNFGQVRYNGYVGYVLSKYLY